MKSYYVIEESYEIEDFYTAYSIMNNILFETIDKAKEYLNTYLAKYEQRDGQWERNEYKNSMFYSVELYRPIHEESDSLAWEECEFYIQELILQSN